MIPIFRTKAPEDCLDYTIALASCLLAGETLTGAPAVTASPGSLTIAAAAVTGTGIVFWASGGVAGTVYRVTFSIVTSQGRTLAGAGTLCTGPPGLYSPE